MSRFTMGVLAVLSVVPLACSSGGDGDGCAEMADAINDCIVSDGGTPEPYIRAMCTSATCTGSKQALIDYVIAHECNEAMQLDSLTRMVAEGCTFPATCTGAAYWLAQAAGEDVEESIQGCEEIACTGSKTAAIACMVALNPLTSDLDDVNTCLTDEGCPAIEEN